MSMQRPAARTPLSKLPTELVIRPTGWQNATVKICFKKFVPAHLFLCTRMATKQQHDSDATAIATRRPHATNSQIYCCDEVSISKAVVSPGRLVSTVPLISPRSDSSLITLQLSNQSVDGFGLFLSCHPESRFAIGGRLLLCGVLSCSGDGLVKWRAGSSTFSSWGLLNTARTSYKRTIIVRARRRKVKGLSFIFLSQEGKGLSFFAGEAPSAPTFFSHSLAVDHELHSFPSRSLIPFLLPFCQLWGHVLLYADLHVC